METSFRSCACTPGAAWGGLCSGAGIGSAGAASARQAVPVAFDDEPVDDDVTSHHDLPYCSRDSPSFLGDGRVRPCLPSVRCRCDLPDLSKDCSAGSSAGYDHSGDAGVECTSVPAGLDVGNTADPEVHAFRDWSSADQC